MAHSPDEPVGEYMEAFLLYDKRGDGKIDLNQLGEVLRALGTNPTEAEVMRAATEMDPNRKRRISFDEFYPMFLSMRQRLQPRGDSEEYFIECFRVFDKNCNGTINSAEFRHVLSNLGEKLSDEQVDSLIQGYEDELGHVYYEELVRAVLSG